MLKTLIFDRIEQFCIRENLISPDQSLIIGLSGGPDSVFLVYFFKALQKKYNLKLIAAHVDHGWRTESPKDAAFCKQLCFDLGIEYHEKKLHDIKQGKRLSGSLEQDARNARRAFFQELAAESHADAIALAHHQDDLIETFFIRLIRGSGLSGLTGIKPHNGLYIRPLLEISKKEILAYLQKKSIHYCIDTTNQDSNFLRNNIRHTLVPAYCALDKRATENLVRALDQLQQADKFIEKIAQEQFRSLMHNNHLDCKAFFEHDPVVQHRILLLWIISSGVSFTPTENFFAEILRFFKQPESKTHWIASTWGIKKTKHTATIIKKTFKNTYS
ncbi:MAG: tRNA lysidine(34) synthetase TilS [Candidatus Babeliaceae bacterium]|nr:tRNA lysidine(34) synthetase TilS [Candidatus Babeliaceae bacterium]